jgi:hypothetical protein
MKAKNMLQRILLISLIHICIMSVSYGQAAILVLILGDRVATEEFHLSIDGAINLSSLPGLDEGKLTPGVNFGLGTHIKLLGEKWHLKPEFKPLSRKGARMVNSITTVPPEITISDNKIKLNYIDVPVLLQYNISPKLFVSAGPQISFLTDANQYSSGELENGTETTIKINTKTSFNNINFSFPLEAGYSLSLATKRSTSTMDINIFVRYEYGFAEIYKDPEVGSSRISLFQFGLSLPFIKTPEELAKSKK